MTGLVTGLSRLPLPTYFPSPERGVWHLWVLPIRAYALFIIIGIIVALVITDRRWVARGGERGVVYDIALWVVPFGLIGGRLYHLATDWQTYFAPGGAGFLAALRIWDGGLGIWGAVALGAVGGWIGCRQHGIPLPAFGDAVAPGLVLAQAIGRLGNYFNQELYGRETTLPWGLEIFYRRDPSGFVDPHSLDGVSTGQLAFVVQPTFLYELLWNVLVFVVLLYLDRKYVLSHGRLFATYVALYCVGRFWVELLRDDTATHIAGIRINSFTSTFVFIGAVVYVILATKGREDPETLRGYQEEEPEPELATVAAASGAAAVGAAGDEPAETAESDEAAQVEEAEPDEAEAEVEGPEEAEAEPEAEVEPEAAEAEPVEPQAAAAEALEPEVAEEPEAEAAEAEAAEAEAVEPEVAEEPEAEAAEAEAAEAEAVEPEVAEEPEAEAAEAEAVEPEVAEEPEAEAAEAEAAEADELEAAEAEAVEPEVAEESQAEEPEPGEPESADDAEAAEPEVAEEPEAATEEPAEPVAMEPEALEPEITEPEAVEPESIQPEAVEPEAVEPEVHDEKPEAQEAEPAEPEAEAPEPEPEEPEEPEADEPDAAATDIDAETLDEPQKSEEPAKTAEAPAAQVADVEKSAKRRFGFRRRNRT